MKYIYIEDISGEIHLLFFYKHKGYKHIEARMLAEKQ